MPRSAAISVRVADEVKAALEKLAADDRRSPASYVEKLLVEHLRTKGLLSLEKPYARRVAQGAADAKAMAHSAIDKAMQHSTESAGVRRGRRRALTEMPARAKDRHWK